MMGFDTFTSKELMNITEYTPLGSWPTDDILVDETIKSMDATPDQQDLVYTITVQGHGDYPTEKVIENHEITVSGAKDEATNNQWEYYINEIHEVDKFIGKLKDALAPVSYTHLPATNLCLHNCVPYVLQRHPYHGMLCKNTPSPTPEQIL